jgi:hypothetical protein
VTRAVPGHERFPAPDLTNDLGVGVRDRTGGAVSPRSAFATPGEAEAFAAELERRLDGTLARDRLPTG